MKDTYRFKGLRKKLASSLAGKGINDEGVLKAIEAVPRHFFLDTAFGDHAYEDKPFPIGAGQTISQPFTVAYQTQILEVNRGDKVLEIGTGSGYQACILAEMGAGVYSIERVRELYERFMMLLPEFGYDNIHVYHGDGTLGLPDEAPFDRIIITAAAPDIPWELFKQLKTGGIMIVPVGSREVQKMLKLIKTGEDSFDRLEFADFRFVPLIGKKGWKK